MKILLIRTDNPEAEIYLYGGIKDQMVKWQANRQLAETLLSKYKELLKNAEITDKDLQGVIVFRGPGSYTGLRIGLSFANTLAYSLNIPIVGTIGNEWREEGIRYISSGKNDKQIMPFYEGHPHTTIPKK